MAGQASHCFIGFTSEFSSHLHHRQLVQAQLVPKQRAANYIQDVSLNLTDTLVISNSATGAPGATGGMGMGGGVYASGGAVFMQGVDIAAR